MPAIGVAFVAFADTSVLSRTMAIRRHETVDNNDELLALGLSNIGAGLFQGFPISSSSSRTPVAEDAGARTQLTGVVAAIAMIVIAIAAPSIFRYMPEATLAAIVMAAAFSLIDIPVHGEPVPRTPQRVRPRHLGHDRRGGAGAGDRRRRRGGAQHPQLPEARMEALHRRTGARRRPQGLPRPSRHPEGRVVPGLLLYRFDAPLFFANARYFADDLDRRIAARDDRVQCVIVTAEPITDVDATAAEMLHDLLADLTARNIELRFAELKGTVHERVDRYRAFHSEMPDHTARTTGEAVKAYIRAHDVHWVDWEDRRPEDLAP